jgi:hypothetical protein
MVQVNPIVAADVCDKLLEACARLAEAELAVQVAQSMRGLGIPVGYVAHGCVLRALCMAGGHEVSFDSTHIHTSGPLGPIISRLSCCTHPLWAQL